MCTLTLSHTRERQPTHSRWDIGYLLHRSTTMGSCFVFSRGCI